MQRTHSAFEFVAHNQIRRFYAWLCCLFLAHIELSAGIYVTTRLFSPSNSAIALTRIYHQRERNMMCFHFCSSIVYPCQHYWLNYFKFIDYRCVGERQLKANIEHASHSQWWGILCLPHFQSTEQREQNLRKKICLNCIIHSNIKSLKMYPVLRAFLPERQIIRFKMGVILIRAHRALSPQS